MKNPDIQGANVFAAMMAAISNSSQSIMNQQAQDAESTKQYGLMEIAISDMWYNSSDINWADGTPNGGGNLQYWIDQMASHTGDSNAFSTYQALYQAAGARAQQATQSADSLVNMSNSQVSTDASNVQSVNQLASMLNIMGYIANLLAK